MKKIIIIIFCLVEVILAGNLRAGEISPTAYRLNEKSYYPTSLYDFEKGGIYYLIEKDDDTSVRVVDTTRQFYEYERNFMADCYSYSCSSYHAEDYSGNVVIPETVEHEGVFYTVRGIGWAAFNHCSELISVEIPNSVEWVWDGAFYHCPKLERVKLSPNIKYLQHRSMAGCTSLKTLDLTYIEDLGEDCVVNTPNLEEVVLPCVKAPYNYWFVYLSGFDNVKRYYATSSIPFELSSREGFCEQNYKDATLYVPRGSAEAYRQAPIWENFENIVELDSFAGIAQNTMPDVFTLSGRSLNAYGGDVNVYTPAGTLVESIRKGETVTLTHGMYVAKSGAVVKKIYVK